MQSASPVRTPTPLDLTGFCYVFFAFDLGFQVDLDTAAVLAGDSTRQRAVRARRSAPLWFDYTPPPLRLGITGTPLEVGGLATDASIDVLVYDFGAALLTYRLPLPPDPADWARLSSALYADQSLRADATSRVSGVLDAIRPAVQRPRLHPSVEDYTVFAATGWNADMPLDRLLAEHQSDVARCIEAEPAPLAPEQIGRIVAGRTSYGTDDLAIIDWNAAVLFDPAPEDVLAVLQHANVELLELRVLDQELDDMLDKSDETLAALSRRRLWPVFKEHRMLARFAGAQTDAAVLFEGVNNAIKLLGNQYLARLYRLTAERLDLPAWQRSVQRKLAATDSVYQKMSDVASTRRLETLEWVIIILIALSMVLPFVTPY
ncbi:MAG: hypothetical protein KJZ65_05825 [Phycisphaerales bacterium]|nr:hypothetical protein [Phycisphaerales bacterium]